MEINPIAFQIGPLEVRWYGLLMSISVALGAFLALKEAERQKINGDHVLNLVILVAPLGWIGARIYHVLFEWDYYSQNLIEIPMIWLGGLAIHGGLIAGVITGWIYTRINKLRFWQFADIFAPSIILGQAIGRWGNYFNQEAYGYATDLPWAMYIAGAYRHPTFLYESAWNLGVFLFLLWLRRRPNLWNGSIFLSYISLYSVGRFWIEFFRTDSFMLGSYRVPQLVSVLMIIVAFAVGQHLRRTRDNTIK